MKFDKGLAKGIAKISLVVLLLVAFGVFVLKVWPGLASGASVWTDKEDYSPGDVVYIFGSGFSFNSQVNITITRPDSHKDFGYNTTDGSGNFVFAYVLDGIEGTYLVEASDGENYANTTFTDEKVETYSDSSYTRVKTSFMQGETVYVKGTGYDPKHGDGSEEGYWYMKFFNGTGSSKTLQHTSPWIKATSDKVITYNYPLSSNAPTGTWTIEVYCAEHNKLHGSTTFTVTAGPDSTPPTVCSITTPTSGAIKKGTFNITADASDDDGGSGIQKVEFWDGIPGTGTKLGEATSSPYSYSWATTSSNDGSHTLYAKCFDNADNFLISSGVTIIVDNTEPNSVVNEVTPDPINVNSFIITGSATDDTSNIVNVQWQLDSTTGSWNNARAFGDGYGTGDGLFNSPMEQFWFNTGTLSEGSHTVYTRAVDQAGNIETSYGSDTFCIDTTPPSAPGIPIHSDTTANTGYDDDTSLDFSWTAATDTPACSGVDHYVIYKSVNGGDYIYEGTSPTNSYTLTGSDGNSYKIKVEAVDKANNVGLSAESATILVDTTPPVISDIIFTPGNPSNVNTPYITFKITDSSTGTPSGVDPSTIRISDGTHTYTTSTSPAIECTGIANGYSCSITWSALADGDYTFTFDGKDLAGNSAATQTVSAYTIDTVKPITSDNAPSGWQTSTFTVTLTESDPSPSSGIAWTKYCVDTTNTCAPDTIGTSISFSTDGQYYLRYHSKDNAGNVQDIMSKFLQLDTTPPTTTDNTDPTTPWYATDRTVTLTCSDAISGCANTYYCVDTTGTCTPTELGTSVAVTCDDENVCLKYVRYYSTDVAGNTEPTKTSNVIKIDKQKPTGYSISVDGVSTSEYMAGTVTVRCNGATDKSGSGVNASSYDFEYSLDSLTWITICTESTSSCLFNTSAITDDSSSLRCRVSDNVGNVGDWAEIDYAGIDNIKPTSTITYPSDGEWLSKLVEGSSISITGTAVDSNSGVQKVEISTSDVGGWNLATGTTSWTYSWALPADGTYTISSRATDSAKPSPNVESTYYTITVHVDSTNPTVSITLPTEPADASPGWYKGTISISHTETDNMALKYCEYRYNSGSWSTIDCNTPFSFDTNLCPDGANTCTVDVRVWDMADNFATDSKTFSVDNSAPVITTVLLSDNTVKEGTIITITSDGTDPQTLQSCAAFTYDSLGNLIAGSEQALGYIVPNECDGPYTLPTGIPDGTYQIRVRARNHAGTDSWSSADIIVDDTSPTISNTAVSDSIVQSGTIVNITTIITDNLAGIDSATTKAHIQKPDGTDVDVVNLVDDGTGCDVTPGDNNYCGSWTAAGVEGTYYVDIAASDNAGNLQTQDNGATIIVDNTPPVVHYVFPGKNWVGNGISFYTDALVSDDVGFDTPTYCSVGIDDGSGYRPIGSILYSPTTGKCYGYVRVNDTFAEGSASLVVSVQDAAGNSADKQTGIGIDNTPPIKVTFYTNPAASFIRSGQRIFYNITLNQDMSGLESTCFLSMDETSWDSSPIMDSSCSGYYVVPTGLEDGAVQLILRVKDVAGNWLNDSINFMLDNSAPTKEILSPVFNASYSSYIPFLVNITDHAGVNDSTAQFRISNDWECLRANPFNPSDPWTWVCFLKYDSTWITLNHNSLYWYNYSTQNMSEGMYYFRVKVCDILGNCGDPQGLIIIDKTAPSWPSRAKLTVTYSPYDKDGNITLSWPEASDASGIDHYNIYVYNSTGDLIFTDSTNGTSYEIYNLKDGTYTFNVTAVDKAMPGNENSGLVGSTTVDTTCRFDVTCVSTGGGGVSISAGGGFLPATTTTVPSTTTLPSPTTTLPALTTTQPEIPKGEETTTTTTMPTTITGFLTGLVTAVSSNIAYQLLIALAVIAVLLIIFRIKKRR